MKSLENSTALFPKQGSNPAGPHGEQDDRQSVSTKRQADGDLGAEPSFAFPDPYQALLGDPERHGDGIRAQDEAERRNPEAARKSHVSRQDALGVLHRKATGELVAFGREPQRVDAGKENVKRVSSRAGLGASNSAKPKEDSYPRRNVGRQVEGLSRVAPAQLDAFVRRPTSRRLDRGTRGNIVRNQPPTKMVLGKRRGSDMEDQQATSQVQTSRPLTRKLGSYGSRNAISSHSRYSRRLSTTPRPLSTWRGSARLDDKQGMVPRPSAGPDAFVRNSKRSRRLREPSASRQ